MRLDDEIINAILSDRCKSITGAFNEMTIILSGQADGVETTVVLHRYTPCCLANIVVTCRGDVIMRLDRLPVSDTLCSFVRMVAEDRQEGKDDAVRDYKAALAHLNELLS